MKAGIRGLALVFFLGLAWAHAAGAGNGFQRIQDIRGKTFSRLTVTRTQVLAMTSQGLFTRPLGESTWTRSLDTLFWEDVFPMLPNGDTLLAGVPTSADEEEWTVISMNRGQSWAPIHCPGHPRLLCRLGFFCEGGMESPDFGLYWSRDLGKTWAKLSADTVVTPLALWKNGIAGLNMNREVFKIDPATKVRSPLDDGLSGAYISSLFNVGDSLFALTDKSDRLFRCQAGSERWIPVWENPGYQSSILGFSPFGITRLTGDSLFWSRDYGATWQTVPAPASSTWDLKDPTTGIVPEENRLLAPTTPLQRWESGAVSWVPDVAGLPKVMPRGLASDGKRLFAYDESWLQSASPDSVWKTEWEPEGRTGDLFQCDRSIILTYGKVDTDKMLRIDSDGRRTIYQSAPPGPVSKVFAGSGGRIFASFMGVPGYMSASFQVITPTTRMWAYLSPGGAGGPIPDWFAMDGERIVTGAGGPPFYSPDGGNTWNTCPLPGNPRVHSLAFTGGAFMGFTDDGIYSSVDPPSGWKRAAFQGDRIEILASRGDTVVARDSARLLLTVDGGRIWSNVEPPFAPKTIKYTALAWSSICLVGADTTAGQGIQCGSLSSVAKQLVVGIDPLPGRGGAIPKLRLNWGRIESVLPGGHGPEVSVGVDGRIRPALRAR